VDAGCEARARWRSGGREPGAQRWRETHIHSTERLERGRRDDSDTGNSPNSAVGDVDVPSAVEGERRLMPNASIPYPSSTPLHPSVAMVRTARAPARCSSTRLTDDSKSTCLDLSSLVITATRCPYCSRALNWQSLNGCACATFAIGSCARLLQRLSNLCSFHQARGCQLPHAAQGERRLSRWLACFAETLESSRKDVRRLCAPGPGPGRAHVKCSLGRDKSVQSPKSYLPVGQTRSLAAELSSTAFRDPPRE
jgi:hypothetical protein